MVGSEVGSKGQREVKNYLKDRLERKKYTGVWMWESELKTKMMSRFPNSD